MKQTERVLWGLALCAAPFHLSHAQTTGTATALNVQERTEIPGAVLSPGAYQVQLVKSYPDRAVIAVDGGEKVHVLFVGVNANGFPRNSGPVPWTKGATTNAALRGFVFTSGRALEFVYPKAEAVALAKKNDVTVVAVDPASEGKPTHGNLSMEQMQEIHLWSLTPTIVGPENTAGIAAKAYHPPVLTQSAPGPDVARVEPPATPGTAQALPGNVPRPKPQHIISALPRTGSNLPWIALIGVTSLSGALFLTSRKSLSRMS